MPEHEKEDMKETLGIKVSDYPAIRMIKVENDHNIAKYKLPKNYKLTLHTISNFIKAILNKKAKPYYLSQNPKNIKQKSKHVTEVVGMNF